LLVHTALGVELKGKFVSQGKQMKDRKFAILRLGERKNRKEKITYSIQLSRRQI